MKKSTTLIILFAGLVSGYSQGQIQMFDYGNSFAIQIFTASSLAASTVSVSYGGYTVLEEQGNTVGNDNPGDASYTGAPLGSGYDIELLAGAEGTPLASLVPVPGSIVTTWLPGSGVGYWNSPDVLPAIPGITTSATVAIAAWNNEGGTLDSLSAAQLAGAPWGISDTATTAELGYGPTLPPSLPSGLTSFSLGASSTFSTIPEPSTIALGVIGASTFLMRRSRKEKTI